MTGRGLLAIGILAAWGAGIAAFVQREASRSPREKLAEAAARIAPGATYFAVEREARHVGFASSTIDTIPGGLQVTDYLVGDLPLGGALQRVTAQSVVRLTRGLGLRDFTLTFGREGEGRRATGRTLGDSLLEYVVQEAGAAPDTTRVRLAGPLLLPTLVPLAVALGESPEVGHSQTIETFDPLTMAPRALPVRIRAESLFVLVDSAAFDPNTRRWLGAHADTVRGFHLVEGGSGGFDAWVDELGRMIAVRGPAGLSMRRTAYEVAFENWRTASPLRLAREGSAAESAGSAGHANEGGASARAPGSTTAIAAGALHRWRSVDTLRLLVPGAELSRLAAHGGAQQLRGDTITVTRVPFTRVTRSSPLVLPLDAAQRARFASELRPEPMLEVEDPAIAALARRLRQRNAMSSVVAMQIARWVADSVAREPMDVPPSASGTLRIRRGDANEHAQLFVSLARAAGVPARAVSGLLLIDGRFHYHAWAEVMAHDWVGIDPTTGDFPVDASHVRLLVGGLGAQRELARLTSRWQVTVLSQHSTRRPSRATTP
jgi:hypothetical protein